MEFSIRTQTESDDYNAIAELWNSRNPEDRYSATEFEHIDDDMRKAPCKFERYLAFSGDKLVGFATAKQFSGQYHPQKFAIDLHVDVDFEKQGIGTALYEKLVDYLKLQDAISVRTGVRENLEHAVAMAEKHGFKTTKKDFQLKINPQQHDFSGFAEVIPKLAAEGILIKSLAELGVSEENRKKVWQAYSDIRMDVPRSEPATQMSYESFSTHFLDGPDCSPDSLFIAVDDSDYIGVTNMWQSETSSDLYTGLTGVKQGYRGRGVATALKARAMLFAQDYGSEAVYTDNDTNNVEMLKVNEKFGFEQILVWLGLVKEFHNS